MKLDRPISRPSHVHSGPAPMLAGLAAPQPPAGAPVAGAGPISGIPQPSDASGRVGGLPAALRGINGERRFGHHGRRWARRTNFMGQGSGGSQRRSEGHQGADWRCCRHSVRLSLAIAAIGPVTAGVLIWEKVR